MVDLIETEINWLFVLDVKADCLSLVCLISLIEPGSNPRQPQAENLAPAQISQRRSACNFRHARCPLSANNSSPLLLLLLTPHRSRHGLPMC